MVESAGGGPGPFRLQYRDAQNSSRFARQVVAEVARARGATAAFLYEDGLFADKVRDATNGCGVDVVFDPVGKRSDGGVRLSTCHETLKVDSIAIRLLRRPL